MQREIKFQSFLSCKVGDTPFNFSSNEVVVSVQSVEKPVVYPYTPPQKLVFEDNFKCKIKKTSNCSRYLCCFCLFKLLK